MRTIGNAPFAGETVIHTNYHITNQMMNHMSVSTRAHFLHKPYANDFRECIEAAKNKEVPDGR